MRLRKGKSNLMPTLIGRSVLLLSILKCYALTSESSRLGLPRPCSRLYTRSFTTTAIRLSSYPWEDPTASSNDETEETLLRMNIATADSDSIENVLDDIRTFARKFPFAAVLPVQPLQYLPTGYGVDVKFLRKKTPEKGSVDGGLRFFVEPSSNDTNVEITVKRMSEGQFVSKHFSEKQIVQAFVQSITEYLEPSSEVSIQSVFHKWLS